MADGASPSTRPLRIALLAATVSLALSWSTTTAASPSVWARAANPARAHAADAIEKTDRAISKDYSLSRTTATFRRAVLLRKTLAALRKVKAATSTNPHLRYRLAQVHYRMFDVDGNLEHIERAAPHFELVADADTMPRTQRARALMSLAICYARLGRHGDEIEAYSRAIALQPDPISHAVLLSNQAEGFMAQGHIIAAVRGYRASLRATPSILMLDTGVTTMWGLGVALDRSGNLRGAIESIRRARTYDPGDIRINGSSWFYVPEYDRHWYEALGHWQIARDAKNPNVKTSAYESAVTSWRTYINRAPLTDPWLSIADFRADQCEEERLKAMDRIELQRLDKKGRGSNHEGPTHWLVP